MTHYRTTFTDGQVREIKNSRRQYSHAWRVVWNNPDDIARASFGFAGSRELAEKAARSTVSTVQGRARPGYVPPVCVTSIAPVEIL